MADSKDDKAAAATAAKKAAASADEKARQIAEKDAQIAKLTEERAELERDRAELAKQEFPKMIYHADFPARIVNSREEQDRLTADQPGWVETTADLPAGHVQTGSAVTAPSGMPSDAAPHSARVLPKGKA